MSERFGKMVWRQMDGREEAWFLLLDDDNRISMDAQFIPVDKAPHIEPDVVWEFQITRGTGDMPPPILWGPEMFDLLALKDRLALEQASDDDT